MRIQINTTSELITLIEDLAQKARAEIGKTRTKLESNELKGQVYAYNEVIYYIKEFQKTQEEKGGSQDSAGLVADGSSLAVPVADGSGSGVSSVKVAN